MKTIRNLFRSRPSVIALAGAAVLAGSAMVFALDSGQDGKTGRAPVNVPLDESVIARESLPQGSYAPIVKKVAPGVVKIVTTATLQDTSMQQQFPGFNDPFWRRFFGDQFGPNLTPRQFGPQRVHGLGSGVIVTKDGYILTNDHVVDHATEVKVTLPDGREFEAKVVGRDPKSDVAVVKIEDEQGLPVVPMADSENVEVGDVVLAIGNPFGVGQTVTKGIVSAIDRGNMGIEDYEDFIQTDAAINPGNSGGALVDIEGRLIGINTAILSRTGGNQGVGFAIPSNLARTVMDSLIQYGKVTRGYLGVMIQNVTPALAREFDLKDHTGALIGDVVADGPAEKAGFEPGDVVVNYDGKKVKDSRNLQLEVAQTKPGTTVPVEILRDGSRKNLKVTVKQLPETEELARGNMENANDTGTLNGVGVTDLDQRMRRQFNVPDNIEGALVTQVDPSCAAAEAGLKPGAVIQDINHHRVKSAEDAVKLTEHPKDKRTLVRVWQEGGSHYVVVDETDQTG